MDALHQAITENEAEHDRIIALLDTVIDGIQHNSITRHAIDGLSAELMDHFKAETDRMAITHYPWSSAHVRDHHRLEVLLNLLVHHHVVELGTKKCIYQIRDLFIDHIKQYDREFDVYLQAYLGLPSHDRRAHARQPH